MKKSVELFYKEGGSDKIYQASIEEKGNKFVVNFAFGRRGTTLKTGTKTSAPVSEAEANEIYDELVQSKMQKGYKPIEGDAAQVAAYNMVDKEQLKTGIHCQLLNPIEEDEVEKYINDDSWIAQEKHDGKRMLLKKSNNTLTAINRKGLSVGYPTCWDFFKSSNIDLILDGEAIGDKFYVFDVINDEKLDARISFLEKLFNTHSFIKLNKDNYFVLVETARTKSEKKKLFNQLQDRKAEGIVFKKIDSKYVAGRPASYGNQIKFKFYATASFIVLKVNKKRSVAVGLYDEHDNLVNVGNVTITPNFEVPEVNQIIEVRYLYAYKGGSIYQPTYLGVRDDIDQDACTLNQLKYKANIEDDEEN